MGEGGKKQMCPRELSTVKTSLCRGGYSLTNWQPMPHAAITIQEENDEKDIFSRG